MKFPLAIFLLFLAVNVFSQAPEAFNYQGVARDMSGNPITNSSMGLKCSILHNSESGTAQYVEKYTVQTNSLGLFQLEIGSGSVLQGDFSSIDWSAGTYFLKTEIDIDNDGIFESLGASKLLSVPYALFAKNSKWNDSEYSNGINHSGGVIIGGDSSNDGNVPLIVNNDQDEISFNGNTAIGMFVREYNGSTAALGIYGYPDTDKVLPHLRNSSMIYATADSKDLILCAANTGGAVRFITDNWTNPNYEVASITKKGLGIGTTEAKAKLHVNGGDIYIEDASNGVIMTSPNGQCWRMTVDNSGQAVFSSVACPN